MRERTAQGQPGELDTNTCSWWDTSHDEHTFGFRNAGGRTVSTATVRKEDSAVRRRQRHTSHRRVEPGSYVFRPGGPVESSTQGSVHRVRAVHARCDDPRTAARAAAVRRRHILLAVLAVALLVTLASPWSGRGKPGLTTPGPTPVGTALTAHSTYIVQPGDTLWSIAERLDPQGDPRPVMGTLSTEVGGTTLRPGERLILP
jgi:nucleoid-associated protein YgaU